MKSFHQFQEDAVSIYRSGKKGHQQSLEARRQEALARSKEQREKAQQKPNRPKAKAVQSGTIKSKTPSINVAKTVTSIAKAAVKKLRRR